MHTKDHPCIFTACKIIIRDLSTICRSDFAKPCARRLQDIGNPKITADLNQFAAGYDHLAAARQGRKYEIRSRCAIIDHDRGFGPDHLSDQSFDICASATASAGLKVIFDRAISRSFNKCRPGPVR